MNVLMLIIIIAALIAFGVIGILAKIGLATVKFFLCTSLGGAILVAIIIWALFLR